MIKSNYFCVNDVNLNKSRSSQHPGNELVDVFLSISPISTSLEGMSLGSEASPRCSQLERPEEVVSLLEVLTHSLDLVDEVLNRLDTLLSERLLNNPVIGKRNALLVDLAETTLKNQFANGLTRRITESDVWLHTAQQVSRCLVDPHEDTVVDLPQSENAQDPEHLGVQFIDTPDSDHKGKSWLGGDVDLSGQFGLSACRNLGLVSGLICGLLLLGPLEDGCSLGLVISPTLLAELLEGSCNLGLSLLLLSQTLGFGGCLRHYHKRI